MPTFAELKAKAAGAANTGKEKFNNVRDRNTSVPMAKTNWDPYSGESAPPPPPPRSLVNKSSKPKPLAPLPPPPSRTGSVTLSASSPGQSRSVSPALPSRGSASPAPPPPPPRKAAVPPPPPPRSSSASYDPPIPPRAAPGSAAGVGPPPIVRSTRPGMSAHRVTSTAQADTIDWTNLTPEDKQVFFSWLDEFFSSFTPPPIANTDDTGPVAGGVSGNSHAPPPLRATSKPPTWSGASAGRQSNNFVLSHPPKTTHGSAALDLAHYFLPDVPWPTAWYTGTDDTPRIPPPLVGDAHHTYASSWMSLGADTTIHIGVIFSDLSVCWGTVGFSPADAARTERRSACYLPPPQPLGRAALLHAHETYGETIALYAESFVGTGQFCSRGECWDLADQALKYCAGFDYVPKPIPSINRTHGHLIYEARAGGGSAALGRWRGGDDSIRRGDIVEWRKVRIGSPRRGSYSMLGDPDHTAVIVCDCAPATPPVKGASLQPSDLGVLVVVEQSVKQPPERKEYDLAHFEEGELWIYRPISMEAYLGVSGITATPPEGIDRLLEL